MSKKETKKRIQKIPSDPSNRSLGLVIAGVILSITSIGLLYFVISNKIFSVS
ncbi:hypothetical protein EV05_1892 [Prochlorococcus sp. MIT 0601]|nr:hypothetical protein EV05_1892 [Prochlorococcus sp. MIT 0601]